MLIDYQKQWQFLKRSFESGSLSHAYLFSGQDIESIKNFTKDFAKLINCLQIKESKEPCYDCQNCRMIENKSFPDLLAVNSSESKSSQDNEKDMMEISIEQIRDVQNFLGYKAYYGNYKVVIIENAERMNREAQNCFLKNLEEPKGRTIIFLLTPIPDILLATIHSRCQQLKFFSNNSSDILPAEKLILNNVSKIINSDLSEKFNFAKNVNLDGENFINLLGMMQKNFRNNLLDAILNNNKNYSVDKLKNVLRLIDKLLYQSKTSNINQRLALEILLLEL